MTAAEVRSTDMLRCTDLLGVFHVNGARLLCVAVSVGE